MRHKFLEIEKRLNVSNEQQQLRRKQSGGVLCGTIVRAFSTFETVRGFASQDERRAALLHFKKIEMKAGEIKKTEENVWTRRQDALADQSGLSVLLVNGHQPPALAVSNNNSICAVVQSSETHAHRCEPYCGEAFQNAIKAKGEIEYRCHAGLHCVAAPLKAEIPLVAIVGRAFLKTADYRELTERVWAGDWQNLPEDELFENVLIADSMRDLTKLKTKLQNLSAKESEKLIEFIGGNDAKSMRKTSAPQTPAENFITENEEMLQIAESPKTETREVVYSLNADEIESENYAIIEIENDAEEDLLGDVTRNLPDPRRAARNFGKRNEKSKVESTEPKPMPKSAKINQPTVQDKAQTKSEVAPPKKSDGDFVAQTAVVPNQLFAALDAAAWRKFKTALLKHNYKKAISATLKFLARHYKLESTAWLERSDSHFSVAVSTGKLKKTSFNLRFDANDQRLQQAAANETSIQLERRVKDSEIERIEFFPIAAGEEIKAAVVIGGEFESDVLRRRVAGFCREISLSLEVVRLREEVSRRALTTDALHKINESLKQAEAENDFDALARIPAELLKADRSSLLVFDETAGRLKPASATGERSEIIRGDTDKNFGNRVAAQVFKANQAVIVQNVETSGLPPAPDERGYHSKSFVSLPITIGNRKIGVLNVTEKQDGAEFDEKDLILLETIAPQLGVALDRARLQRKTGELEVASTTDALTGLLNRRYLEERLAEELRRSSRHGYPMSFMMIDVDDFKSYNDEFGHQAGDEALRLTAQCLHAALRSADVAVRYGGEEFSILLPQTTLSEARAIAERIRKRVETTRFPHRRVTISIGIAAFSQTYNSPQVIVKAADAALYEAKRAGKNNVRLASQTNSAQ